MPQHRINAKEVKEKILKFLKEKGPSLPVQIAKHVELNSIFASAFLSELASEGAIKISDMKVGGSPLYFTSEKVEMLENFMNYLGPKEREACLLLKEKGLLEDTSQTPVIRVALRSLKDFAQPLKRDGKVLWKYFSFKGEIAEQKKESKEEQNQGLPEVKIKIKPGELAIPKPMKDDELKIIKEELEEKKKELERITQELFEEREPKQEQEPKAEKSKKPLKKPALKKKVKKIEDKFLKEIKSLLESRQIELLKVEQFDKRQVFATVKLDGKEHLLAAYDKKKINDSDLLKAYKKALALKLPYCVFSKGEPSKKTKEAIEAYKSLVNIELILDPKDSLKQ